MKTQEIECQFLEIDKEALIKKLRELGAEDKGEVMLEETIVYDSQLTWKGSGKWIRIRRNGNVTKLAYKEHVAHTFDGTHEIEFKIDDFQKAEDFFEKIGFVIFRRQQKKRHTFLLNGITFDIDTWPKIPTYLEIEGESEEALKEGARMIGYDWSKVLFNGAGWIIQNIYKIPVVHMKWFTFDRVE